MKELFGTAGVAEDEDSIMKNFQRYGQNTINEILRDLCAWKDEWLEATFQKQRENARHEAIFLSKRPDLLKIDTDLPNVWFGVTITRKSELWRLQALKENVRAKHYHVTPAAFNKVLEEQKKWNSLRSR